MAIWVDREQARSRRRSYRRGRLRLPVTRPESRNAGHHRVGGLVCIYSDKNHLERLLCARQCPPLDEPARPLRHCRRGTLLAGPRNVCARSRHRPCEPAPEGGMSAVSQTPGAEGCTRTAVFANPLVTYDVPGEATPTLSVTPMLTMTVQASPRSFPGERQ